MKEEEETKLSPISLRLLKLRLRSPLNPHVVTTQELEELENLASLYMTFCSGHPPENLASLYVYFCSLAVLSCSLRLVLYL